MAEQQAQSGDYISLYGLKNLIRKVFLFLFRTVDFFAHALKTNVLALFAFTLAGLGISYLYYLVRPAHYKVEMIVFHNDLPRKTYHEIISNLNWLLTSNSYPLFADELKISETAARSVAYLETKSIYNLPLVNDTSTKVGQPFKIAASLHSNSAIDTLQNALINFLNSNPYIRQIKEGQQQIYDQKLAFIDGELEKLDSLKINYNHFLLTSRAPATFYNNAFNPADAYAQSADLANQKASILKWKNDSSHAIMLIDNFKSTSRPRTISLALVFIWGILSGLILGILWALLRTLRKSVLSR